MRYPARDGLRVTTFAVETFGRLGQEAEVVLTELAAAVRRRNLSRGLPAGCPLRRWRARLSGLVARGFARTLRAAARVDPERGTHPRLPVEEESRADSGLRGGGEAHAVIGRRRGAA